MPGNLLGHVVLASATERAALAGSTTVATFTDSNLSDLASGFTATINWGDGTATTGTIAGSNGSFSVLGGHTYADEGNFILSATVARTADGATLVNTGNLAVAESDVLSSQGTTISGDPGTPINNVTVATFTDTDTAALASDFTAIVDWGDGTSTTGTIAGSNGAFTVAGSHTYAAATQDVITVTVVDALPGSASTVAIGTATIGVSTQVSLVSATERVALGPNTVVAHITDGNHADTAGGFTATIDWGDGSPTTVGTITGSNGVFSVEGGHTYADEGNFTVTANVVRTSDATVSSDNQTVVVNDSDSLTAHGTALIAPAGQAFTHEVATFSDTDLAALAGEFVATIDWGDGTTTPGTIAGSNGSFAVTGSHTYATTSPDTITVTMEDPSPGIAVATATSFRFDHVNQPPVNTVPGTQNALNHTDLAIAGFSVADPDATTLTTTLHVDHGALALAAIGGGAAVSGSGTGTVTLVGSVAQIDATLGHNVVYTSNYGFFGTDTLTMTSTDSGGAGGVQTDTDKVAINVTTSAAVPQFAGYEVAAGFHLV